MSDNDENIRKSPQLAQMAIGFLLGSGGAGAAMALVGQEGFQMYGIITFVICVLLAVGLVFIYYLDDKDREKRKYDERQRDLERTHAEKRRQLDLEQADRSRRENLQRLADFYDECFKNTGINLALRLQAQGGDLKPSVLKMLLVDLDTQEENISRRKTAGQELIDIFHNSIQGIRNKWQELAEEELIISEGLPDEGAKPLQVNEPKAPPNPA
jgi:uncharacterized membrane protein